MLRCGLLCKFTVWLSSLKLKTDCFCSIAGSDSTSGALRAIFYFLMKHPQKMSKLVQSIDEAFEKGILTHPVQYNHAMKVPYLKAVIQESLRLFPPFGVPMPRYAPSQGLQISGHHIPAGSKVSVINLHCTYPVLRQSRLV
jgi:cytochrome P450